VKHSEYPSFALVGHPNKGKSSIVSTLAYDDSVGISATPGETTQTREYPLKLDGEIQYRLYDTPGFQSPRRVLQWLKTHETTSSEHPAVIKKFIAQNRNNDRFRDEIELLTPISNGAGIVYVVDASKPYSEEYESEMEILRWSGRPSIALINTIDKEDYTGQWQKALNQHFKMVRKFNPMSVSFQDKIDLLEALSHLDADWTVSLKKSITILKQYHEQLIAETALLITDNIYHSIVHKTRSSPFKDAIDMQEKERLSEQYINDLVGFEYGLQKKVEKLWGHRQLRTRSEREGFYAIELFSEESRKVFGLSRSSLAMVGAAVGAGAGGSIGLFAVPVDGGATTLLGASVGAVAGAVSGLFGYGKYLNIMTLGGIFGTKRLQIGPMKDENFPFILLARCIHHAIVIANRSHAKRDEIDLKNFAAEVLFDTEEKKKLGKLHVNFKKNKKIEESKKEYTDLLETIIRNKIV